jgi:hypothetical protein
LIWIVLILIHLIITIHWRHLSNMSSRLSNHVVLLFVLLNLLSKIIDFHVLGFQLLLNIPAKHSVSTHAQLINLQLILLDLLLKSVFFNSLIIDFLQKLNVLRHNL